MLAIPASAADPAAPLVQKILLPQRLHLGNTGINPVQPINEAAWIWHPAFAHPSSFAHAKAFASGWREPVLLRFHKDFEAGSAPLRIHVSADERFELFLDGQRIARGPDRSDVEHWSYATYEIKLPPGPHRLAALGSGDHGKDALITAEQAHDPGLAEWQALVAGKGRGAHAPLRAIS